MRLTRNAVLVREKWFLLAIAASDPLQSSHGKRLPSLSDLVERTAKTPPGPFGCDLGRPMIVVRHPKLG
jgi:hypothetical protein